MKKAFACLLLIGSLLFSFQNLEAQSSPTVLLKSGDLKVPANLSETQAANSLQALDVFAGRRYGLMQFEQLPDLQAQQSLLADDIRLLSYLPHNAYLVSLPLNLPSNYLQKASVRGILPWSEDFKTDPLLKGTDLPDWALTGDYIELSLAYYPDTDPLLVDQFLQGQAIEVLHHSLNYHYVEFLAPLSNWQEVASWPFVSFLEPALQAGEPEQTIAKSLHRSNLLNTSYSGGRKYDGEGVKVMVRDDGGVGPHIDFQGRILQNTNSGGTHGDNVAGCMAGAGNRDPQVIGMAPAADIYVLRYNSTFTDATLSLHQNDGVMITNSSYSQGCNGGYNSVAARVDLQIYENPSLLHVFSAGNQGNGDCSYGAGGGWGNITGGHKTGKNVLTVGSTTSTDNLSSFSSRGPAEDGRLKPDIMAMGSSYRTTIPGNNYTSTSGTSFSAPAAAGVTAQLYHAYRIHNNEQDPPSALIKAIMLNTADDLGNHGPDFRFGWGRVNAFEAAKAIENKTYFADTMSQGELHLHDITIPAGLKAAKIMVYWPDQPASPGSSPALINDLNIKVISPDTSEHLPFVLDPSPSVSSLMSLAAPGKDSLNNMEQVELLNPQAGTYTLRISGDVIPLGNSPYYVVYEWVENEVTLTYPAGGEGIAPGEVARIRWDAPEDSLGFDLEYTIDNGANWTSIVQNLSSTDRYYDWTVPNQISGQVRVRIINGSLSDESDANLTIMSIPNGINFARICQDYVDLVWNAVNGATEYEVFVLGERFMESVGTTTATHMKIPWVIYTQENWFSVRALGPDGLISRRAIAIPSTPNQLLFCAAVPPVAQFTMDTIVCVGEEVPVLDSSRNAPINWGWSISPPGQVDFVNGTNQGSQNPVLRFRTPGTYRVSLAANNAQGVNAKNQMVTVLPSPSPDFSTLINGPTIDFTNLSSGTTTYQWYFGDGDSSALQDPQHTYPAPGNYTVTLVASGPCGDTLITKEVQAWATGLEDPLSGLRVDVAPNPSSGLFELLGEGLPNEVLSFSVLDLQGKALSSFDLRPVSNNWNKQIDLSYLPAGIYFLRMRNGDFTGTMKLSIY